MVYLDFRTLCHQYEAYSIKVYRLYFCLCLSKFLLVLLPEPGIDAISTTAQPIEPVEGDGAISLSLDVFSLWEVALGP